MDWPAYAAGLDVGDEVRQLDRTRIGAPGDVATVLQRHRPGDRLDIVFADRAGEIYAIYLEAQAAGTGIGRALLSHATSDLLAQGCKVAVLWVLESNARARRFYELAGWKPDGATKEDRRADHVRYEVRYRRDLL